MFSHSQFWGLMWRRDDERFHIFEASWVQRTLDLWEEVGRLGWVEERDLIFICYTQIKEREKLWAGAGKWMVGVILLTFTPTLHTSHCLKPLQTHCRLTCRWVLQDSGPALPGTKEPQPSRGHVSLQNTPSTYKKHNTQNIFFAATPTSNLFL